MKLLQNRTHCLPPLKRGLLAALALSAILALGACGTSTTNSTTNADDDAGAVVQVFDANAYRKRLNLCVEQIRTQTDFAPDIAVMLDSEFGSFVDGMDVECTIPYTDIDVFPGTTESDRNGNIVFGTLGNKKLVVMQGHAHLYEGYNVHDVVFPVRVIKQLGVQTLVMANTVGAINEDLSVDSFMVAEDQIASFVPSPLVGENLNEFGERFVSMNDAYDSELQELVLNTGEQLNIPVHSGVFAQVTGPQLDTPAEVGMFQTANVDAMSMCGAVEAIAARHAGLRLCTISCVTNMAAGINESNPSAKEVANEANDATSDFIKLLTTTIEGM